MSVDIGFNGKFLSGGEKQRLAIALESFKNKDVIIFDEPTSSLDFQNKNKIVDLICGMHGRGKIIIVVTHDDVFKSRGAELIYL